MAQFDVYENPDKKTNKTVPYLLDIQADLLNSLATRVVAPLMTEKAIGRPMTHINPEFHVNKTTVYMSTPELAGIPVKSFGKFICSLKDKRTEIINALDFLFTGI